MGTFLSTCVRLLLTAMVLAAPTLLMGGTLPAMARFAVSDRDDEPTWACLLYGMNTLGAVVGASAGTFYLLEHFGNHATLFLACGLNVDYCRSGMVGCAGRRGARAREATPAEMVAEAPNDSAPSALDSGRSGTDRLCFPAHGIGLVSNAQSDSRRNGVHFGLILAVALLGIGSGGVVYSLFVSARRPTLNAFACTCALEALFLAIPYALGDQIALSAMLLKPLATLGFGGRIIGWLGICGLIVFPPALLCRNSISHSPRASRSGPEKCGIADRDGLRVEYCRSHRWFARGRVWFHSDLHRDWDLEIGYRDARALRVPRRSRSVSAILRDHLPQFHRCWSTSAPSLILVFRGRPDGRMASWPA